MPEATLKFEPVAACGTPTGIVAYVRMPLKISAMPAMNSFLEQAYGKGCVCREEPKGWLRISTAETRKGG